MATHTSSDPAGTDTAAYYELVRALVASQERIWGQQAVDIADEVPGLAVSSPDDVWVVGNERQLAGDLAEAYVSRFGQAAETSLCRVASEFTDDVALPPILQQ